MTDSGLIAARASQILENYYNLMVVYFNIFSNSEPMDVTIQVYDSEGVLRSYTVPNRAKSMLYVLNGSGTPEASVNANVGSTYQDTTNGDIYLKTLGSGNTGWNLLITQTLLNEYLIQGDVEPEGLITASKGLLYIDKVNNNLYIKTTSSGNTGWSKFTQQDLAVATTTSLGIVQIGDNIEVDEEGIITVPKATDSTLGVVQIGSGLAITDGVVSAPPSLFLDNYIDGFILSNNGNTSLNISSGVCMNTTNTTYIRKSSVLTLNMLTNGTGGLDIGSIAASAQYHVFIMSKVDGTTSSIASTSLASPLLPSGYVYFRRIGSVLTDSSSHILPFYWDKNIGAIKFTTPLVSYSNSSPPVSFENLTLPVPPNSTAILNCYIKSSSDGDDHFMYIKEIDINNCFTAVVSEGHDAAASINTVHALVNSGSMIQHYKVGTSFSSYNITTLGYIDCRGKQ